MTCPSGRSGFDDSEFQRHPDSFFIDNHTHTMTNNFTRFILLLTAYFNESVSILASNDHNREKTNFYTSIKSNYSSTLVSLVCLRLNMTCVRAQKNQQACTTSQKRQNPSWLCAVEFCCSSILLPMLFLLQLRKYFSITFFDNDRARHFLYCTYTCYTLHIL